MLILGIETSCDDTGVALLRVKERRLKILSNLVSSQIKFHRKYGGVVPEIAARKHLAQIIPLIEESLRKGKKKMEDIDLIAVTQGPGLLPSLLIGVETAKMISFFWQKPLLGINHLEGHLFSFQLNFKMIKKISFPSLCLIVSGGHTEFILLKSYREARVIGRTLDDAAGEAFDKGAKMLGLSYPGGPLIEKLAKKGNPFAYHFPRPMINSKNLNFSFAGLKTALLYFLKDKSKDFLQKERKNICASFQEAILDVLVEKSIQAIKIYRVKNFILGGGVTANLFFRQKLKKRIKEENPSSKLFFPLKRYSQDNGAIIALAAYFKLKYQSFSSKKIFLEKLKDGWRKIKAKPDLEIL